MIDESVLIRTDQLRHHRAWFLGLGIVLVILGVIAIALAVLTTIVSVVVFGWVLVIGGIVEIVHAFRTHRWGGLFLHLLTGLLGVVVGLMFVRHPLAGALTLTLILGGFFVVEGVFRLVGALYLRFPQWPWVLVSGVITALLGMLLILQWPVSALWFIGFAVGVDMIFRGAAWTTLAVVAGR